MLKIRKQIDKKAITLVHKFIKSYLALDENDEKGHQENEEKFLTSLCDLYDPEDSSSVLTESDKSVNNI